MTHLSLALSLAALVLLLDSTNCEAVSLNRLSLPLVRILFLITYLEGFGFGLVLTGVLFGALHQLSTQRVHLFGAGAHIFGSRDEVHAHFMCTFILPIVQRAPVPIFSCEKSKGRTHPPFFVCISSETEYYWIRKDNVSYR